MYVLKCPVTVLFILKDVSVSYYHVIIGNFMYFSAYAAGSKYLILGSRFMVGLGAGAGATIFAELAQTTTEKQRTTIFSLFMAMRQLGLVIGEYDSYV